MAKKIYYCEKHPDTVAPYQCTVCKKRMCYNCTIFSFGKFYCSIRCLITDLSAKTVSLIFQIFSTIWSVITFPLRKKDGSLRHVFIEIILLLLLSGSIFFIFSLNKKFDLLIDSKLKSASAADSIQIPAPEIFKPNKDGMVLTNTITVKGKAEKGRIISLLKNNDIVDVKLVKTGTFEFKNVKLHRGVNKLDIRAISSDGKISNLETITLTYAPPSVSYLASDFNRGPLDKKAVAFTFDAGAEDNAAGDILRTLQQYNIKATFFLTGRFIKKYPKTVLKIVKSGHEVGNHTLTHPHLTTFATNRRHDTLSEITKKRIRLELSVTDSLFFNLTGRHMARIWRAPYGEFNHQILLWAAQAGYRHVGWTRGRGWKYTLDTMDWVEDKNSAIYHTANEICEKVINFGKGTKYGASGIIILMHLGTNRKDDFPHKELGKMIKGLSDRGYTPVTITQLMGQTYSSVIDQ